MTVMPRAGLGRPRRRLRLQALRRSWQELLGLAWPFPKQAVAPQMAKRSIPDW